MPSLKKTLHCILFTMVCYLHHTAPLPTTVTSKIINSDGMKMREQKLEIFKRELLNKIGMKERPAEIYEDQPIPQALIDEFDSDVQKHEKEFWEREESSVKKVIVEARPFECKDAKCIQFKYSPKDSGADISDLNLWVYQQPKQKNPVIKFSAINPKDNVENVLLRSRIRSSQRGWASINISKLDKWLSLPKQSSEAEVGKEKSGKASPFIDLIINVECTGCHVQTKGMKLPLLEFQERSRFNRRQRRSSTQCHNGGKSESCCLDDFIVTFKELGWGDWIISPKSYNAKQCRGSCEQSHTGLNDHASIMKLLSAKTANNKLKQCCSPQRLEPLYILYRKEHKIVKQEIPDMIKAECGCA